MSDLIKSEDQIGKPCSIDEIIEKYKQRLSFSIKLGGVNCVAIVNEYKEIVHYLQELKKFHELFDSVEEAEQLLNEHMV